MKRGDVVKIASGSGPAGKPRPAIVVQSDAYPTTATIMVAPVSSDADHVTALRPILQPDPENGLRTPSVVMINLLLAIPRHRVGGVIGTVSPDDLARIDTALLIFLGLA